MKTPKRVKGYVRVVLDDTTAGELKSSRRFVSTYGGDERVARVVELRRGEAIVDVEALFKELYGVLMAHQQGPLRAALRKVGKR